MNEKQLEKVKPRSGFDQLADYYDVPAFLQREVGDRLLERLDLIRMQPEQVLDLGCGNGEMTAALHAKYRKAHITGLDLALSKVQKTRKQGSWLRNPSGICADASRLPLRADSMDMVLSNLMLHECNDLPAVFNQLAQTLRPEGLLLFSTLGPDTLKELRTSWVQVDGHSHIGDFVDMHDVGDALLQAGFRDPVMDMEVITLTYGEIESLLHDLQSTGVNDASADSHLELAVQQRMQGFCQAYEQFRLADGKYPATYEVIYGHAWAPEIVPAARPERYIPIRPQ